ncbi:MAG: NifU family protein [Bacteroidales bacterium]|nr:NifU family protein [Bacteroidales bacterium]HOK97766.1 NifU family protein [Bacteroidales bacterium]HPO64738.1 NifU family protein [Bacteroidales bacterium]
MSNKDEIIQRAENALDKIRPYLQADGGDVKFVELTHDNVLIVDLIGACEHCPFSKFTLKLGVEQTIMQEVPEIQSVVVRTE